MISTGDREIWEYAKKGNYATVTQGTVFHEQSLQTESSPLVIWLRCGNQRKNILLDKLLTCKNQIEEARQNKDNGCIDIY